MLVERGGVGGGRERGRLSFLGCWGETCLLVESEGSEREDGVVCRIGSEYW